jgi:antitoxin CptB
MAWALGSQPPPPHLAGELLLAMQKLDYVDIPR